MQVKWKRVLSRTVRTQGFGWVGLKRASGRMVRTVSGGLRTREDEGCSRGEVWRTSVRGVRSQQRTHRSKRPMNLKSGCSEERILAKATAFERQPNETAKAFAAFSLYLNMGPERTAEVW